MTSMKKVLVAALVFTSASLQCLAQDAQIDVRNVRFGAYIAPNVSWMHPVAAKSDDGQYMVKSTGSKVGYAWGLMVDYFFAENYGLVTGFQINTTGGKLTAENVNDSVIRSVKKADFEYDARYLEVPLALKLRTDDIAGFRFFGQIGVTAGVNIGKKATYDVSYYDQNKQLLNAKEEKVKLNGTLTMAPVMLQLNVGGGIEYPLSNKLAFYAGIFFNNGFLPDATNPDNYTLKYSNVASFKDGNTRLNNVSLRVGLFF